MHQHDGRGRGQRKRGHQDRSEQPKKEGREQRRPRKLTTFRNRSKIGPSSAFGWVSKWRKIPGYINPRIWVFHLVSLFCCRNDRLKGGEGKRRGRVKKECVTLPWWISAELMTIVRRFDTDCIHHWCALVCCRIRAWQCVVSLVVFELAERGRLLHLQWTSSMCASSSASERKGENVRKKKKEKCFNIYITLIQAE